ncbi:4a-hydroxytetrahydrobiopterin dehydratase [Thauera sp.]|mgnify:FL=1|jgi:4a-hydroxytetrahydrobiopterin dehydratase|uniref:4a-hydroxytetrahydrobiopterin dehydratase n=1 Tax=Thauera sp. TaxID=1905334 RepID=UPI002CF946FD|nr:4a-hydroxytetrahydrobiopterin dehydratase [Thauera sp.]HRO35747.1 4a-hydroxytetrahydrobiopterin dehydratase [Thauera sp.]
MSEEIRALDEEAILAGLVGLPHWRLELGCLVRDYRSGGWKATLMVAGVIGHLAEAAWHHPVLELSWDRVRVRLSTHSPRGITGRDFALARKIEEVVQWQPARESGVLEGTPNADERFRYIQYD